VKCNRPLRQHYTIIIIITIIILFAQ